jgi:hypothetical protein
MFRTVHPSQIDRGANQLIRPGRRPINPTPEPDLENLAAQRASLQQAEGDQAEADPCRLTSH